VKLAFIEPHLKCVGGIRRILEVANRLQQRGHGVRIFSGYKTSCTWMPNAVPISSTSKLKDDSFDVTIFNLAEQYKLALEAKAACKIFWVLAPEALYKPPAIPVLALRQPFHLMANSRYIVNYIRKHRKVDFEIPIIPGGINPAHFRYDPAIQKQYDVVYYGSKRPWKGTKIIEQALASLRVSVIKIEGLDTPQVDMYKLYNQARVCVTANLAEGFSYLQLEAMACGCAVVCTDDGGSRDYVKPSQNAVVAPRESSALAGAVRTVLGNEGLRTRLVLAGLQTAHEPRFNWDSITTLFEEALQKFSGRSTTNL
jgi:glycosyltransferase involved in cell wall biosynthesis